MSDTARPAETVSESVPARHETPDMAELRRLAEAATPGPWAARYGVSWEARVCATTGSLADVDSTANAELIAAAVNALPGLLGKADALLDAADRLAHMAEARNNARAERDALRTWQERVAVAAGIGEEVEGRGVYLEANPDAAAEHVAGLLAVADTHIECPVYCSGCGEPLADALCDHCSGSGCGPGTALGAYEECEWCAGAGKVHPGCADLSYADLVAERDALAADADKWQRAALTLQRDRDALTDERDSLSWQVEALRAERDARSSERDALAAKVERVRALPAKHPAGGWYMTSMRDVLAALDEEPQP